MDVVDSPGWLAYLADEPNAEHFAAPLTDTDRHVAALARDNRISSVPLGRSHWVWSRSPAVNCLATLAWSRWDRPVPVPEGHLTIGRQLWLLTEYMDIHEAVVAAWKPLIRSFRATSCRNVGGGSTRRLTGHVNGQKPSLPVVASPPHFPSRRDGWARRVGCPP